MLKIDTSRIEGQILVVKLSGTITRWGDQCADEPFILESLSQGEKRLIVDLSGIEQMDSSGVQLLFECDSLVRAAGGELHFAGATARVARLIEITRLDTVLRFYPTIAQACEGFPEAKNSLKMWS